MATQVDLKQLLESGAHFGHQTRRWNPKMKKYIFGVRGGIHIIDLVQTGALLEDALKFVTKTTENGGDILFVATKRQAKNVVKDAAVGAGMPYVSERWLGGMLTNWNTISKRITRLKSLEEQKASGEMEANYNKKEVADFTEEIAKLNHVFSGVKDMKQMPAAIFVVDAPHENTAILEARRLNIPVIAFADTNANPDLIDYVIPANDDAIKAVTVITKMIADAASAGKTKYAASHKEEVEEVQEEK